MVNATTNKHTHCTYPLPSLKLPLTRSRTPITGNKVSHCHSFWFLHLCTARPPLLGNQLSHCTEPLCSLTGFWRALSTGPSDSNNDLTFHVATNILEHRTRDNFVLGANELGWEACKASAPVQARHELSGTIDQCPLLSFTLFLACNAIAPLARSIKYSCYTRSPLWGGVGLMTGTHTTVCTYHTHTRTHTKLTHIHVCTRTHTPAKKILVLRFLPRSYVKILVRTKIMK